MRPSERAIAGLERCAERAAELVHGAPAAEAPLHFAAGLYRAQAAAARLVDAAHASRPLVGDLVGDLDRLHAALRAPLDYAVAHAPAPLADQARAQLAETAAETAARLDAFWRGEHDAGTDYLARACLRPYVAVLVAHAITPVRPRLERGCPRCGGAPIVALRRAAGPSEGAARAFVCALCGGEWGGLRGACPGCGEEEPDKLPCFQVALYPAVRIEACESCHVYVKSIDLTLDARPVPEVDDLVSIAVDLRAQEEGFIRLEIGLAGV